MTTSVLLNGMTSVSSPNLLGDNSESSLCIKISYEKMRLLCQYPVWNMISEFIRSTRSYNEGLALSASLMATAERHSDQMSPNLKKLYQHKLWLFHLDMLDKLDLWPDYLTCFKKLRDDLQYCNKWKSTSGISSHPHFKHYFCGETSDGILIHFLIGVHERKEIVERKLQRQKAGKSIEHLHHHTQKTISTDELRQRVEFLVKKFTPYMPLCR